MDERKEIAQGEEARNEALQGVEESGDLTAAQPVAGPAAQPASQPAPQPAADPQAAQPEVPQPASPQPAQPPVNPYGAVPRQPAQPGAPVPPHGAPGVPPVSPFAQPSAPVVPASGNGKAVGALVCGILSIVFSWTALPGVILGIVAIVLAGSYIKGGGLSGKAKAGRICGIVGIVFSVLTMIFSAILGAAIFSYVLEHGDVAYDYSDTSASISGYLDGSSVSLSLSSSGAMDEYDAEEQKAIEVVSAELDKLKNADPAVVEQIATLAEEGFAESANGLTMEQCGIDSTAYAKSMLRDFDYEIQMALALPDSSDGFVSADVTCRDVFSVLFDFGDQIDALSASGEMESMTQDETMARVGEIFNDCVENVDITTDGYISIDITNEGGAWKVDQASWDEEIDFLFGLA